MRIISSVLLFFLVFQSFSQQKYWVYLSDKEGVTLDPYTFFDAKAIQRRIKHDLPLVEESDKPIRQDYYQKVQELSDTITGHSRWFNALSVVVSDELQLQNIQALPFVLKSEPMLSQMVVSEVSSESNLSVGQKSLLKNQLAWLEADMFAQKEITGKGIRICIIDAGFPGVDNAATFKHIRAQKNIIATWDFHKNQPNVYKFNSHGATVLSCIAGKDGDQNIGMATEAEFLLARTERLIKEGLSEEEDWLMAVEWADKNGADIINSSLGYTSSLYFNSDMDGQTALISRAGNMAAHKGILVVNAMGNEGDGMWKYVTAPADADSVLSVGGINPWTGVHTAFSSYGPTADKRMKPNVSAFGHVIAFQDKRGLIETQGTSFSSPLVAGFAACVLQYDSTLKVMDLFRKIEQASNLYPYFDYAHGYGVPLASNILNDKPNTESKISLFIEQDSIRLKIDSSIFKINDQVVVNYHSQFFNRRTPKIMHVVDSYISDDSNTKLEQPNYIYYHLEDANGVLEEYSIIAPHCQHPLNIPIYRNKGKTLRVWYQGHFAEILIKEPEIYNEVEEIELEREEVEND